MSDTSGVFLTVTEGGTIIASTPALPDGPAQYEQLHTLVGGYLEVAFQCPSPDLNVKHRVLQFYCDEDGLSKLLPYNLTLGYNRIVGPIVVVAAVAPEIYGLTEFEADAVKLWLRELGRG